MMEMRKADWATIRSQLFNVVVIVSVVVFSREKKKESVQRHFHPMS